jgi:hypothetical protein
VALRPRLTTGVPFRGCVGRLIAARTAVSAGHGARPIGRWSRPRVTVTHRHRTAVHLGAQRWWAHHLQFRAVRMAPVAAVADMVGELTACSVSGR